MVTDVSCVQKVGMDPRICKKELKVPSLGPSSCTICSSSTSLATLPVSDTPRFRYRVPAKCRERRAINVMLTMRPKSVHLRWMNAPCVTGRTQYLREAG